MGGLLQKECSACGDAYTDQRIHLFAAVQLNVLTEEDGPSSHSNYHLCVYISCTFEILCSCALALQLVLFRESHAHLQKMSGRVKSSIRFAAAGLELACLGVAFSAQQSGCNLRSTIIPSQKLPVVSHQGFLCTTVPNLTADRITKAGVWMWPFRTISS